MRNPVVAGGALALASAVAFGATTPLVQRFGRGVGPFTTAALLYAGAAVVSALPRMARRVDAGTARLRRTDAPRLVGVALLGAVAAPVALAWGLQRTSGIAGSLLLNLEALFTVLLARVVWREAIGARVSLALLAMLAGGALLVAQGRELSVTAGWGALAVVGATLAWAGDSVASRPLADRDAAQVVLSKGALGAAMSVGLAWALGERAPASARAAAALAACGAVGYGASLQLYMRAQRTMGAARTASVFAVAPFAGAAIAWAMGEGAAGLATTGAAALCALGIALHLTERHEHPHAHDAVEHEHPHRHDDGHHDHAHDEYPAGEHSHVHRHEPVAHSHPHAPDVHHGHGH